MPNCITEEEKYCVAGEHFRCLNSQLVVINWTLIILLICAPCTDDKLAATPGF